AYKDGFVAPVLIRSFAQIVDIFTKALPLQLFSSFLSKLGLVPFAPSPTCGRVVGISPDDASSSCTATIFLHQCTKDTAGAAVAKDDLLDQG
ncbi:UNVERIFIED_CONTAM: hypothetical protein Sindi_1553300, partial [Sesamum indicum]